MSAAAPHHGGWTPTRPLEPIGAQMSLACTAAVALLDGAVLIAQFSDARVDSDDVWDLVDRIRTHHDTALDDRPADEWLTTRVRVTRKDGETSDKLVVHPKGTGDDPLSNGEIVAKYRELTGPLLDAQRRESIEKAVLALDDLPDAAALFDQLTDAVPDALGAS